MKKKLYSESQMKELKKNPNIMDVSEHMVSYSPTFKIIAVKQYINGKIPSQIFIEHGIDLEMIGKDLPKRCLHRWKKTFERYGEEGFLSERRGKGNGGRSSSKSLSHAEQLKKAEARIKFLEAENEFLKKLEVLERQALKKKRY